MKPENILALDIGTKMGWAHSLGMSGTFDFSTKRDESAGYKLIRLRSKLNMILGANGVDVLVFEAVRNASVKGRGAVVSMARMQGVIELWCEENNVEYKGFSPSAIKKHATGKGQCGKPAMIEAAKKKWSEKEYLTDKDDNEADALWLLDYAMVEMGLREGSL